MIQWMRRHPGITLIIFGLAVACLGAIWIRQPGYMDADYYYATARQLASGAGFQEPFLWNYLDDPGGVPHPSHLYWLPMTSILAAIPMWLLGPGFRAGQISFILLTALTPYMAYRLSRWLGFEEHHGWIAGLLAGFSGFYLPYFLTTDSFSPYVILGGGILWFAADGARRPARWKWAAVGGLIGIANLTRTDGMLFLAPAGLALFHSKGRRARSGIALGLGMLLTTTPWLLRNTVATGSPFSPAASQMPWVLSYDELFIYPPGKLTFARWWSAGLGELLAHRWQAVRTNLTSLLIVNGMIYQAPFIALAAISLRDRPIVRLAGLYLLLLFLLMSLAFPFAGARGGFFHSSAALMPLFWSMAPRGVEIAVTWASKRRRWDRRQALAVFQTGAVVLAIGMSAWIFSMRVIGEAPGSPRWSESARQYQRLAEKLEGLGYDEEVVAINNPPGFYLASGMEAIVIPDGGVDELLSVMRRYGAEVLVLDVNHPAGLDDLYTQPEQAQGLSLRASLPAGGGEHMHIFEVKAQDGLD